MTEICPACSTSLVDTGPPINENYCPNEACTHDRDEMLRRFRESHVKHLAAERVRNAAPDMLAALTEIAAFDDERASEYLELYGSYQCFDEPGSVEIARAALAKALGRTPNSKDDEA